MWGMGRTGGERLDSGAHRIPRYTHAHTHTYTHTHTHRALTHMMLYMYVYFLQAFYPVTNGDIRVNPGDWLVS